MDDVNLYLAADDVPADLMPDLEALADRYGGNTWNKWQDDRGPNYVYLGWRGTVGEQSEVAAELAQLAARAEFAWLVYDEPSVEFLGTITAYKPGLGQFEGDCNADGNVVVASEKITKVLYEATTLDEAREKIDALTGRAWFLGEAS